MKDVYIGQAVEVKLAGATRPAVVIGLKGSQCQLRVAQENVLSGGWMTSVYPKLVPIEKLHQRYGMIEALDGGDHAFASPTA